MNIKTFIKKHEWYYKNTDITDAHFPAPKKKVNIEGATLLPLDKYYSNTQSVLDMLKEKGLRPATIHELIEYVDAHWSEIKGAGKWYPALGSIWEDAGGGHRVPGVDAGSGGGFDFGLGDFESAWDDGRVVLVFSDKSLETKATNKHLDSSEPLKLISEIEERLAKLKKLV